MRKEVHDQIITDFSGFTFSGGAPMFSQVVKALGNDITAQSGTCLISLDSPSVDIIGNTSDDRILGFSAFYIEFLQSASQSQVIDRVDRISNVEDRILDYLQKEPSDLRGAVSGVDIYKVRVTPSTYSEDQTEHGIVLTLTIRFQVHILLTPQLL